jgi:GTP-binding protein EngB required for normal cell division
MCGSRQPGRPEYSLLCLGLTGAGKSAILATLANEDAPKESTTGTKLIAVYEPSATFFVGWLVARVCSESHRTTKRNIQYSRAWW